MKSWKVNPGKSVSPGSGPNRGTTLPLQDNGLGHSGLPKTERSTPIFLKDTEGNSNTQDRLGSNKE